MSSTSYRTSHRTFATLLFLPLFITFSTGFLYRFLRNALGIEKSSVHFLLDIHQLNYLSLQYIYPLLLSLITLLLLGTGCTMSPIIQIFKYQKTNNSRMTTTNKFLSSSSRSNTTSSTLRIRTIHSYLSIIMFIPLTISSLTASVYVILRYYLQMSKESTSILLTIHQGSYLGDAVYYVTSLFIMILPLWLTGVYMLRLPSRLRRMYQQVFRSNMDENVYQYSRVEVWHGKNSNEVSKNERNNDIDDRSSDDLLSSSSSSTPIECGHRTPTSLSPSSSTSISPN